MNFQALEVCKFKVILLLTGLFRFTVSLQYLMHHDLIHVLESGKVSVSL